MTRRRLIRLAVIMVLTLLGAYLLLCLFALAFTNSLMWWPPKPTYEDDGLIQKIHDADGTTIATMYLNSADARYTILFSHGNGEDLGMVKPLLKQLHAAGFSVLAYDYPGYGHSGGRPTEAGAYAAVNAAYAYLSGQLGVPPDRIIVMGRSIGGGPSVDLAAREPVAGLILQSTFTSIQRTTSRWIPLPGDRFRSIDKIGRVRCPVLVIHGTADGLVKCWHGRALYDATTAPKQCLWVEGAGHGNVERTAGEKYVQTLRVFAEFIEQQQEGDQNQ